jgi:hypothetical protein
MRLVNKREDVDLGYAPLLFGHRTVGARRVKNVHLAKPLHPDKTREQRARVKRGCIMN